MKERVGGGSRYEGGAGSDQRVLKITKSCAVIETIRFDPAGPSRMGHNWLLEWQNLGVMIFATLDLDALTIAANWNVAGLRFVEAWRPKLSYVIKYFA